MADKIVIGFERLPTLEILGKEYPYDASSEKIQKELEELSGKINPTFSGVIDVCKQFITLMFCGNEEVAQRIEEVYGDRALLWIDAIIQMTDYLGAPRIKGIMERTAKLKRAADKK